MTRKIALLMIGVFVAAMFAVISPPVTFGQEIKLTYANFPPAPTFPSPGTSGQAATASASPHVATRAARAARAGDAELPGGVVCD